MVVEAYKLVWALPRGWERSPEDPEYAWGRGPGGNPQRALVEELVAKALLVRLHPLRSEIDVHTLRTLGEPSWRMHPQVAHLLMRATTAGQIVQPALTGGWTMFGWPIERDPTRPVAHGDPRTWSQGAHPCVELGWTVTSGPTD